MNGINCQVVFVRAYAYVCTNTICIGITKEKRGENITGTTQGKLQSKNVKKELYNIVLTSYSSFNPLGPRVSKVYIQKV